MPRGKQLAITERQFEVLNLLWEHGPLTVREVRERLPRDEELPYTTVLGLLQVMELRGPRHARGRKPDAPLQAPLVATAGNESAPLRFRAAVLSRRGGKTCSRIDRRPPAFSRGLAEARRPIRG